MSNAFLYDKTVLDLLEKTAERLPDKPAMIDADGSITYSELRDTAQRIGCRLHAAVPKRGTPVVCFMDKGCRCFSAMLGSLYAGSPYVPMDLKTPIDRLELILQTLVDYVVIADEKGRATLEKIGFTGGTISYEELAAPADAAECAAALEDVRARVIDTDIMYILFTSGSTGVPKGVAVMHRSVMDYIRAFTAQTPIEESDVLGNQTPFYVDMSLKDLYMGITVGATICVIPQRFFMTPKKLLTYLDEQGVTMLMWVPTAYSIVSRFDALSKVKPGSLKKILFSGEGMPIPVFRYWREYYPDATYIQQYGPTEITGACTNFIIERDYGEKETIPIGRPFDNTGLILLDENDQLVSEDMPGVPGEICVFGSCLAAGYYNDPKKTASAFVDNPLVKTHPVRMYRTGDLARYDEDGNIVFISRKDYQIKHGGRRIELGEIESGIYEVPEVAVCCCVHNAEKDEIVAFYSGEIEEKALRVALRDRLPQYMLPAKCVKMDELPRLASGKLNRKQMQEWACEEE